MRFVDLAYAVPPDGWAEKAAAAEASGPDQIDSNVAVWQEYKDCLKTLSHDKCYYCEIKEERSDGAVDHYRPKSDYPWSAFRPENLRFCCTFCNSKRRDKKTGLVGGKGKDFPLLDETARATCSDEERHEYPLLLNPCEAGDPMLLDFQLDGTSVSKYGDDTDVRKVRADTSIHAYHLNHTVLVEARRRLAIELDEKIALAEQQMHRLADGNADAQATFDSAIRDLKRSIQANSELTTFARKVLLGRRSLPWVEDVLAAA